MWNANICLLSWYLFIFLVAKRKGRDPVPIGSILRDSLEIPDSNNTPTYAYVVAGDMSFHANDERSTKWNFLHL